MKLRFASPLLAAALLLGGCVSSSGIAPTARPLAESAIGDASGQVEWPATEWWQHLGDARLNALIERALQDNPTLQAAAARLAQAEGQAGVAGSALAPQVALSADSTRERFSEHGLIPPPYAGTRQSINDLQLGGSWALDFFGRHRNELRAALGEVRASAAENQASRQLLASNVARAYYNLARVLAQRELAEHRQQQRADLAALVERRFRAGLDTRVELEAAQGALPENARDIASLDEQIALARHALAALTGQGPQAVDGLAPSLPAVAPLALPDTLPAELLGHRADVVAARWRVEAASGGLDATRALFYPNLDLRAFAGFSAIGFGQWLEAASRQPGIGLAVSLPIFDAGRLRGQYRVAAAQVDSAVANYNATLLQAARDVADQLSTLTALDRQIARQQAALASAERAYRLAEQRYRAEISDRLNVLNVETNLIAQRRQAIELQARWIDSRLRLIQALGGGYAGELPAAALPTPAANG